MIQNHCLAKHIADVAWNQLITLMTYKAEWAGKRVELVNPYNTSQMCSGCGQIVQKYLSERTHSCPFCGLIIDRDHNAAINILRLVFLMYLDIKYVLNMDQTGFSSTLADYLLETDKI